jgi:myo-inositol-1(or 4)-monophosphatase
MHPLLTAAVKAARRAGSIINRASNDLDKLNVERKAPNDFVSEVDRAAEAIIISTIRESYPQHSILAEESGESNAVSKDGVASEYQWIIDPLDGTTNFLHGFPQYCVSIALAVKGVVSHGVIFDPVRNDLFTASRGSGAFLNERRIRVSKVIHLKDGLIGTGFPYRELKHFDKYLATFKEVTQKCAAVRRPGSAALDLAYVACGRFDGFWEMGLSPWDMAAGGLMIVEAGGLITNFDGEGDYVFAGNVVAATPKVFPSLLQIVQAHK